MIRTMYIYLNKISGWLCVGDFYAKTPEVIRDYYVGFASNRNEAMKVIKSHRFYRSGIFSMREIREFVNENWEDV